MAPNQEGRGVPYALEHMSLSRLKRRRRCTREDWWQVEGARGGYRDDAPPDAKAAYALKRLTSLPALVGQLLHTAAASRARAIRDGRQPFGADAIWAVIRAHLNDVVGAQHRARGRPTPERGASAAPILREVAFGEWPGGRIPPGLAALTAFNAKAAIQCLIKHPVWAALAECGRDEILICDALDAMQFRLATGLVNIFAAPDLVWLSRQPQELPRQTVPLIPPVLTVLDWKTGHPRDWGETERVGLAVYAWWVMEKQQLPEVPRTVVGWIAGLNPTAPMSDAMVVLSAQDLAVGRDLMLREAEQVMAARDQHGVVAMEHTTRNLDACRFCNFSRLCFEGQDRLAADGIWDATQADPAEARCAPPRPGAGFAGPRSMQGEGSRTDGGVRAHRP